MIFRNDNYPQLVSTYTNYGTSNKICGIVSFRKYLKENIGSINHDICFRYLNLLAKKSNLKFLNATLFTIIEMHKVALMTFCIYKNNSYKF